MKTVHVLLVAQNIGFDFQSIHSKGSLAVSVSLNTNPFSYFSLPLLFTPLPLFSSPLP
jgi:hypothetical protein